MENCEMISSENVKPSSPTPQHLQTYKLSMLDQIVPSMFVPVVMYFPSNGTKTIDDLFISQTTQSLRDSLSVVLTRFYPLAGRINKDCRCIDCNDKGVRFVVVKFPGSKLSDVLTNPGPDLPRRFIPCEVTWNAADEEAAESSVVLIQVNYFDCGGIAIGAVLWHKAADGMTIATFLRSWAAANLGLASHSKQDIFANYVVQSMFPHKQEIPTQCASLAPILRTGKSEVRRYVFDASAISSLKSKPGMDGCTRVEVVSALIWKCFMAASLANNKSFSVLTHAVNLRRRAQPPLPSECFGNFPGLAAAANSNENENDLRQLVMKMRDAIRKIDNEHVNRMKGDQGFSGYHQNLRLIWSDIPDGADLLSISSWCSFGLYDIDFGWGKPVWLSRCDSGSDSKSQFLNLVWLMDTRVGHGIEAWVVLDEKYMEVFHNVEEIRALASIHPSPLDMQPIINHI